MWKEILKYKAMKKKYLVSQARLHQFLAAGPLFFLIKWVW
jgi:hypothetical protein